MSTNFPLLMKRTGLAATALTGYATAVYFSIQFMSPDNNDNNTNNKNKACDSSCCKLPHSYTTSPNRTNKFQDIANVYDDQISRDEFVMGIPLLRRALIYFHAKGSVLEVGAGTGRNIDYYPTGGIISSSDIHDVVLTDTSDQMLLQARDKIIEIKKKNEQSFFSSSTTTNDLFKVFVADANNMSKYYKENTFDTIVSSFTLCSFDDPIEVLKELQTVCKDDGKILLLEHGRSKSWNGLSNYLDKYAERHAKNWGCVWNRDLDDILDKAGLVVESKHMWHFGTTYYIVCRPSLKVKEEKRKIREMNIQKLMEEQQQKVLLDKDSDLNQGSNMKQWKKKISFLLWKRGE